MDIGSKYRTLIKCRALLPVEASNQIFDFVLYVPPCSGVHWWRVDKLFACSLPGNFFANNKDFEVSHYGCFFVILIIKIPLYLRISNFILRDLAYSYLSQKCHHLLILQDSSATSRSTLWQCWRCELILLASLWQKKQGCHLSYTHYLVSELRILLGMINLILFPSSSRT